MQGDIDDVLRGGRDAYERKAWGEAFAQLSAADGEAGLELDDLERLARSAHLSGRNAEGDDAWVRAHNDALRVGDDVGAARCAFWLGWELLFRGESARSSGWLGRADSLLGEEHDGPERGYLLLPAALECMERGDPQACLESMVVAMEIAQRYSDQDLMALARLTLGEAQIDLGDVVEGLRSLDETMVAVTAGEVSPPVAGLIYCALLLVCRKVQDLTRAREWTDAMTEWCDSQPELAPFRGSCLVHRSEVMQSHGRWKDAVTEVDRACEWLKEHPGIGDAFYQRAELHRLRGDLVRAEEDYKRASDHGISPQPGLALLRMSQGNAEAAVPAVKRMLDEADPGAGRSKVLTAAVEILLETGDVEGARKVQEELREVAATLDARLLKAIVLRTEGAVRSAEGRLPEALEVLRASWAILREMEVPYEIGLVRAQIASALRAMGDADSADIEAEAAIRIFERVGALPDLARLRQQLGERSTAAGLTGREVEVLTHAASGLSNREIAMRLSISEHTVRRHLQNIYNKIGVTSRAAATAFAFQHGLV